jgi:hypothetical protein
VEILLKQVTVGFSGRITLGLPPIEVLFPLLNFYFTEKHLNTILSKDYPR